MGKKQHQQDKLYLTTKEWKEERGGHKIKEGPKFYRVPFENCCLSFQPYKDPYCNTAGYIFDILNIIPFVKKFGIDPVSGEKIQIKDLIKLNIHKNNEGKYHCPITRKEFSESSVIVAVKTSGNVYMLDTIEQLNYKLNNLKDLLTDVPFVKKDIIMLQNPKDMERSNSSKFYHLIHNLRIEDKEEDNNLKYLRLITPETANTLAELEKTFKPQNAPKTETSDSVHQPGMRNAAHYSTGTVSRSLTCTAMTPQTNQIPDIISDDLVRYPIIKKKGYVQLVTNLGNINLQLHCDLTPKTCENFIKLSKMGYYNDSIFFRLVKDNIIQGGDPEGTGMGGESAFKKPFKDEFRAHLRHDQRGIISMANKGRDTNTSQFFITFAAMPDLDDKHTIFGKIVGGMETLDKLENVPVDEDDRPLLNVKILQATVFVDPFEEADIILKKELDEKNEKTPSALTKLATISSNENSNISVVGKYLMKRKVEKKEVSETKSGIKTGKITKFNDFSMF